MFTLEQKTIADLCTSSRSSYPVDTLLAQAEQGNGLTIAETGALYVTLHHTPLEEARAVAESVRLKAKGAYATFYTCSYLTSDCINDCGYCPYRHSNPALQRVTLSLPELIDDIDAVQELGHTNIIFIGGTLPEEQYKQLIIDGTHYAVAKGMQPWIEFENLSEKTLTELCSTGAETFLLFQESYKQSVFAAYHRTSPLKKDYIKRLQTQDRALAAGFSHLGIGALFGLHTDFLYELLGLYNHAKYLEEQGAFVFISTPTIKKGTAFFPKLGIAEEDLERILITLRLALPNVSLALSARESIPFRDRVFGIVDHIGYGGAPFPGGRRTHHVAYSAGQTQFHLDDMRTRAQLETVLKERGISFVPLL